MKKVRSCTLAIVAGVLWLDTIAWRRRELPKWLMLFWEWLVLRQRAQSYIAPWRLSSCKGGLKGYVTQGIAAAA